MIERKSFTGGLSTDRDGAYLQPNQYLNALNIRVSSNEEGSEGALSNIKGNSKVTFTMPSGTNTCIGSYEDSEHSRVFYFIHNSSDDHMILCYFHKEGVIRKVLEQDDFESGEDGLAFSTSNLITGVSMNDDLLFFTDNSTEPKRINVERGLKKHNSSYTQLNTYDTLAEYGHMRDTMITLIRQAPTLPPTQERVEDKSVEYNFVRDEVFTFAYRFVYVDGEVSTLSPYSKVSHHPNPDTSTPETDKNAISIKVPAAQEIGYDVMEVEYLVKFNEDPSFSVFYTERNYNRILAHDDDGIQLDIIFRNDTTKLAIATTDVTRYASAVPVKAKALECARGRVFLGDTTEGLDNLNENSLRDNVSIVPFEQTTSGTMSGNYVLYRLRYINSSDTQVDEYYRYVRVQGSSADGFYTYGSDTGLTPSSDHVDDWLNQTSLNATRYPSSVDLSSETKVGTGFNDIRVHVESKATASSTEIFASPVFTNNDTNVTISAGLTGSSLTIDENLRLWKTNSAYRFGMVFMDRFGRHGRVIELTDEQGVQIPDRGNNFTKAVQKVNFNLPTTNASTYIPDWAHAYSIVRTKSLNKSFFVQLPVKDCTYSSNATDAGSRASAYDDTIHQYIAIDISSLNIENLGYNYSEGDLVTLYNVGGSQYTLQVAGQSGEFIFAFAEDLGTFTTVDYTIFAEIFTPKLDNDNEPYFEFGHTYPITNPEKSTRTWGTSSGYFEGDTIVKDRQFSTGADIHMQSASANFAHANNWIQLTGRGFATTRFQQVHKPTGISFSENRIQGSLLNGLSMFNSLDEKVLPREMGAIKKLLFTSKSEATGNTMLAIGINETASVYIGESQISTGGGSAFIAVQAGVIGSFQILRGSYGTMHPESVVERNNRVYWLDALNGTAVQYDVNGLMPIGNKGIGSFFRERCDAMIVQGKSGCHGGFDPDENEYILTLPSVTGIDQEYLDDYIDELSNADLLSGNQDAYDGLEISVSVNVVKGRKYRVEIGDQTGLSQSDDNSDFDSITIKYSDDTSIGTTSTTDKGGFKEFVAAQDSASLKIVVADSQGVTQAGSDEMYIIISEFRKSYYKLDSGDAATIAYSEDTQSWTTFYSYLPEQMQSVGTQFITFKSGELWKHNVNATRNNFYGTQYVSRMVSISKQVPSAVKVFQSIAIEGDTPPSFAHFRTESKYMDRTSAGAIPTNPTYSEYLQSSDLNDTDFRQYEGVYYAGLYRDRLEPSPSSYVATTYDSNMITGEKLINQFMLFTLEFDNTSKLKVRFADVGFNVQRGHKL